MILKPSQLSKYLILIIICISQTPRTCIADYDIDGGLGEYTFSEGEYSAIYDWDNEEWTYPEGVPWQNFTFKADREGTIVFRLAPSTEDEPESMIRVKDMSVLGMGSGPGPWYTCLQEIDIKSGVDVEVCLSPSIYESEYLDDFGIDTLYKYHAQSGLVEYTIYVEEEATLEADFIVDLSELDTENWITFISTSSSTGSYISNFDWYIDGSLISSGSGVDSWHWIEPSSGVHTVELVITDSHGNVDSMTKTFTTEQDDSNWRVIQQVVTSGVQDSAGYPPIDTRESFTYYEDIWLYLKLGDVRGAHTARFDWYSPSDELILKHIVNIPAPSSQGLEEYSEYIVTDALETGDTDYEEVFSNLGHWIVWTYVDDVRISNFEFDIESQADFVVRLDKSEYITDEEAVITGNLGINSGYAADVPITIEVYRDETLVESVNGIYTDAQGAFTYSYTFPQTQLITPPTSSTSYTFVVNALTKNPQIGAISKSLTAQFFPVWIKLTEVKLVQIREVPDAFDLGYVSYLAVDREAAIRVIVETINLPPSRSIKNVEIKFTNDNVYGESNPEIYSQEVDLVQGRNIVDFWFTIDSGRHFLLVEVDPNDRYSQFHPHNSSGLKLRWVDDAIGKEMKSLQVEFVPVNIPLDDPEDIRIYYEKMKNQKEWIEDLYPIPKEKIKFTYANPITYDYALFLKNQIKHMDKTIKNLFIPSIRDEIRSNIDSYFSKKYFFDKTKVVVALPGESIYWDSDEDGITWGRKEYYLHIKTVAQIRYESNSPVAAHEIAHTYGLNLWREEYESNPKRGNPVEGLITMDGKLYNITNIDEMNAALSAHHKSKDSSTFCFMGDNEAFSWVCEETYIELFNALKDPFNRTLFVSGFIDKEGEIYFDYFYEGEGEPDILLEGNYTIDCVSSTGETLWEGRFGSIIPKNRYFAYVIPYPENTKSIQVRYLDEVIAEKTPTPNQPEISQVSISEDQQNITISWSAFDQDLDDLAYTILYSNDNAENWKSYIIETNETEVSIEKQYLSGGTQCVFKVIASDGFNQEETITKPFTTEDKPPECFIIGVSETTNPCELNFLAIAYDVEDGFFDDESYYWYSDIDGFIGQGGVVNATISQGVHQVTLFVEDSAGNTVSDTTMITVGEAYTSSVIYHSLCSGVDEYAEPVGESDYFTVGDTVYSYVILNNSAVNDRVDWVFYGPNNYVESISAEILDTGMMAAYAPINTTEIESPVGNWSVEVYLNDELQDIIQFTVNEPLPMYVWGVLLIIILVVVAAVYKLFKRVFNR